jgi:hypothetical protein
MLFYLLLSGGGQKSPKSKEAIPMEAIVYFLFIEKEAIASLGIS